MDKYQIAALAILAVYYMAYFIKMAGQHKKGIQTLQMGEGSKNHKTMVIEKMLSKVTVLIVVIELLSIVGNSRMWIPEVLRMAGIVLAFVGTAVFIIAMITMQDSWRAGIPASDKTELVTTGIYRISRNPAFLGFDLVYIGIGIAFHNPVLALVSLLGIVMMHFQILEEERFLTETFGEEYMAYKKKVGRYL